MVFNPKQPVFLSRDQLAFQEGASFALEVSTGSATAVPMELTGMTREGPFKLNFTTDGLSVIETNSFRIPDIPIWITLRSRDADLRVNDVYAMIYLTINGEKNQMLCTGSVGQFYGINWPNQAPLTPLQQHGLLFTNNSANPAANAEFTMTVPNGQYWKLKAVTATLVTDSNAANRAVVLDINTAEGTFVRIASPGIQTASLSIRHHWFVGANSEDNSTALIKNGPLMHDMILSPASTIASVTTNRQVGDNWGAANFWFELLFSDYP